MLIRTPRFGRILGDPVVCVMVVVVDYSESCDIFRFGTSFLGMGAVIVLYYRKSIFLVSMKIVSSSIMFAVAEAVSSLVMRSSCL